MALESDLLGQLPVWQWPIVRWHLQRREAQTCPEPMPLIWFLLGGRGSGKTWTSANHVWEYVVDAPQHPKNRIIRVALIGETFDDVKKTMVEGETGLLNVIPKDLNPTWNRTLGELKVIIPGPPYREIHFNSYTSERPDKLRGPQFHVAWLDEPAKMKDADVEPTTKGCTWSNLIFGLRLGTYPHIVVSGTPTPCHLVKYLLKHPNCVTSRMSTWDNRENLAEHYLEELSRLKPDSRTARQEIFAEVLLDNPDALFEQDAIDNNRAEVPEDADRVIKVLGYDPSASSAAESDETGIVLTAYTPEVRHKIGAKGGQPHYKEIMHAYVLKDLSGHYTPSEQTSLVIRTVLQERVDDLVFEQNQGVEFVMVALEQALKDETNGQYKIRKSTKPRKAEYGSIKRFIVSAVWDDPIEGLSTHKFNISAIHATKNKQVRAETASIRYDSGQVHHPPDSKPLPTCLLDACKTSLESQMTSWNPREAGASPDRLDALVYTLLFIFGAKGMHKNPTVVTAPREITQETSEHGAMPKKKGYASLYSADLIESGVEYGRPTEPSPLDRSLIGDVSFDEILSVRLTPL